MILSEAAGFGGQKLLNPKKIFAARGTFLELRGAVT